MAQPEVLPILPLVPQTTFIDKTLIFMFRCFFGFRLKSRDILIFNVFFHLYSVVHRKVYEILDLPRLRNLSLSFSLFQQTKLVFLFGLVSRLQSSEHMFFRRFVHFSLV